MSQTNQRNSQGFNGHNSFIQKLGTKKKSRLFFRSEEGILAINAGDIFFVERDQEKRTLLHTIKGVYHVKKSLTAIQQDLSSFPNFVRSHRSYLINLEKVDKITQWGDRSHLVKFTNYTKDALISRKNAELLKEILR